MVSVLSRDKLQLLDEVLDGARNLRYLGDSWYRASIEYARFPFILRHLSRLRFLCFPPSDHFELEGIMDELNGTDLVSMPLLQSTAKLLLIEQEKLKTGLKKAGDGDVVACIRCLPGCLPILDGILDLLDQIECPQVERWSRRWFRSNAGPGAGHVFPREIASSMGVGRSFSNTYDEDE